MTEHGHPESTGQDPRISQAGASLTQRDQPAAAPEHGQPSPTQEHGQAPAPQERDRPAAPEQQPTAPVQQPTGPVQHQPAAPQPLPQPGAPQQPPAAQHAGWAPPRPHDQGGPQTGPVFAGPGYPGAVPPGGSLPPTYGTPAAGGPDVQPPRRSGRLRIGVAGLVAGALIGGGAGAGVVLLFDHQGSSTSPTAAQSVVINNPSTVTTATAAAAKAAPSVVTIYVTNSSGAGSGSGVVLTQDGYVLTNNHVVTLEGSGNAGNLQVRTSDGTLYGATVIGTDPSSDLAVIKLNNASGLTPAGFADSSKVQVGDAAVAIGAPLGLSNTVTDGIISATNRAVQTGSARSDATVIDALQTDAPINPGNSGGALVNGAGQVVGINTAIASVANDVPGQSSQSGNIGVGFAIPSNTAQRIAKEIIQTGKATHAVLGVSARTAADNQNPEVGTGAQIVQVQEGSAAADAGLQPGDVITALGNRPVTTSTDLTAAVRSSTPDQKVTLTVRRGNNTQKVDVTLGTTTS